MNRMTQLTDWYESLQPRERIMVISTSVIVIITLFYLMVWEPIYKGLEQEQQRQQNQQAIVSWMQQAAAEANALRASGVRGGIRNANAPVTLSVEQTIATAGLKSNLAKLESSGKDSARVLLDNAAFNQLIIWLNILETNFGITASSANIERSDKTGFVNARLTLTRQR